ncbi:TetR/AcrR family transcriptional regulator [Pigmentiphaga litoralis]|uniref:TetR/AcrR family transcriptional regulator n=1 Tax=Pigmentiphaga litoralis TaxID=516702 RepID=UPI003B43349C
MHLFWEQGFESTSLSQLKAAMGGGISAPSFYAAFESKEALYKEALERYMSLYGDLTKSLHDDAIAPREAVLLTLRRAAKMYCEAGHPKGCMVASGAMGTVSSGSEAIPQLLQGMRGRARNGFHACVQRGIKSGELRESTDTKSLAIAFDSFFMGISVLARDGVPYTAMKKAVDHAMGIWDSAVKPAQD